jgi:hypothetical protein
MDRYTTGCVCRGMTFLRPLFTVSRSDIRLIQYLDSSALGLVRRLTGYFPIHLLPNDGSVV